MSEELNLDPLPDLPEELAELDAELRDIRMEVRPSFGPELEAELERVWREEPTPEPAPAGTRRALAASIGAVLLAGMLVPSARAALAEITRQSLELLGVAEIQQRASASPAPPPLAQALDRSSATAGEDLDSPRAPERATGLDPAGSEAEAGSGEDEGISELPAFEPMESTMPELLDRNADEEAIRRYYPPNLEDEGIGGSVFVRLWVDSSGSAHNVDVIGSSGYPEMDRAAVLAARELRFRPATLGPRATGTLVEFEMTFDPLPSTRRLLPVDRPDFPENLDTDFAPSWPDEVAVSAPYQAEAQQLLRAALGRPSDLERRFGSVEHLLSGEPPAGVSPLRWRSSATAVLEEAVVRDPDNPAPYIALGRIRKRQGLRAEALSLFDEGVARAARGSRAVSPRLVAELNYERGMVLKDAWLGSRELGRISPEMVGSARCDAGGGASVADDLIALNYLCYDESDRVMEEGFQPVRSGESARERMLEAFRAAVEAYPAHVGANVELLLDRADEGRWFAMLNDARSFAWASRGSPYALLMSGLALQRLGRPDDAMADFELALRSLPDDESGPLRDIGPLLSAGERKELAGLGEAELEARVAAFWRSLDPIRLTEVNEREVEHLARATYALLRLGGLHTDAGEVWTRYGRPLTVRALGEGTGLRTEFWDYGRGPDLTFRRPAATADLDLTPEARAYLSDLSPLLPHRYGRQSRLVTNLDAQLGRFRARGDEPAAVTVHGRVPEEMATGPADSLHLGLFVTAPDGEVLSEIRRTLPAAAMDVRMDAPVPDRAESVAMELYHPGLGQAAVLRAPVAREPSEGEDPRISDLVVTEPARPLTRDIRRSETWLVPRPDRDDASGETVGLLFELYDLGPDAGPYRLSVELEPHDRAGIIHVPIRPTGEDRFGMEWPRTPRDAPEFLTLDLSEVGPGTYTLRVVVDDAGTRPSIEAERTIER